MGRVGGALISHARSDNDEPCTLGGRNAAACAAAPRASQFGGGQQRAWGDGGACGDECAGRAIEQAVGQASGALRLHAAECDDGHIRGREGVGDDNGVRAAMRERGERRLHRIGPTRAYELERERAHV